MIAIVIAIRLSAGPIDVTFFKPQLEKSLGDAIGLNVALRQLNLSLKEKRLALLAMGAELQSIVCGYCKGTVTDRS